MLNPAAMKKQVLEKVIEEGEKKAADLLGIPYEQYTQGGLFPIAYTKGTDFKPAVRPPADTIIHWDGW